MEKKDSSQKIADALAQGISGLLQFLSNLERADGGRSGELRDAAGGVTVSYRFGAKSLKDVENSVPDAPDASIPLRARRRPTPPSREQCEPVIDVFDESEQVVVVADMPGVQTDAVSCRLDGDILTVQGETAQRTYRAEVLIETPLVANRQPECELCNGVVRVKLNKQHA